MKKILFSGVLMLAFFASSCSDMLEVEDQRHPDIGGIDQAADSLFYAVGIIQAMQQAADAYVLQNELRGDLLDVTQYSDNNLRQLANFSATATNAYDSAYVYYRVINNCNYYLNYRDTTIYDGSYNVARSEYAAVLSFRAWAYLQLVRNYGSVKFVTKPLASISDIEEDDSPTLGINEIVPRLVEDGNQAMMRFSGTELPYGTYQAGDYLSNFCIPIDLMIGELYLEAGQFEKAADYYYKFLLQYELRASDQIAQLNYERLYELGAPSDFDEELMHTASWTRDWSTYNFSTSTGILSTQGIITRLTMAEKRTQGVTSSLPLLFGYDYYSTADAEGTNPDKYEDFLQLVPSKAYYELADSSVYYYTSSTILGGSYPKKTLAIGDQRGYARLGRKAGELTVADTNRYITLYQYPRVVLFRGTTVWLHLAEALNRMGHPDAAFAILKDGISSDLREYPDNYPYVTEETRELLSTRYPFCTDELAVSIFGGSAASGENRNYGIHRHGCGDSGGSTRNGSLAGKDSPYQMSSEVARKVAKLEKLFPELGSMDPALAATPEDSLAMLVNAVEDLLCDEYAMEFAFEGTRYADLMRLARHKNAASPTTFGANFGSRWLANKLAFKNPQADLANGEWYLPMR